MREDYKSFIFNRLYLTLRKKYAMLDPQIQNGRGSMSQEKLLTPLAVTPVDALILLGWNGSREKLRKTASNLILRNRFPVPVKLVGKHKRVLMVDIAKVTGIADPRPLEPEIVQQKSRGRGRPRKGGQL